MDEQLQQELTDLRNAAFFNMALYDAAMADAQKLKDRIEELEQERERLRAQVERRIKQGQRRIRANAELRAELEAWMRIARRAHVCVGRMAIALMVLKNNGQLTEMQASVVDELIGAAMQEETKP